MPAHLNLACLQHTTFPSGEGASFGRGVVVHLSGVLSWCFSPGVSALGSFSKTTTLLGYAYCLYGWLACANFSWPAGTAGQQ